MKRFCCLVYSDNNTRHLYEKFAIISSIIQITKRDIRMKTLQYKPQLEQWHFGILPTVFEHSLMNQ